MPGGKPPARSDDPPPNGVGGRVSAAACPDLGVEVGEVSLHGVDRQPQPMRNLRVGIAAGNETQHVQLARREVVLRPMLGCGSWLGYAIGQEVDEDLDVPFE